MNSKLAKRAVIGGRAIALPDASAAAKHSYIAPYFWNTLARLGVRSVAEKILAEEQLAFSEVEDLLSAVPLSILMKLVSLSRNSSTSTRPPIPALYIPVLRYAETQSPQQLKEMLAELLASVGPQSFELYLDAPPSGGDWSRYFAIIQWLSQLSDKIRIVVPSVSDMVGGPSDHLLTRKVYEVRELVEKLEVLRTVGVSRLRSAQTLYDAEVTHRAGFPVSVSHTIEFSFGARRIAHELIRLNEFSRQVAPVTCWVPGFQRGHARSSSANVRDLTLLRVLAVGSIALPQVEYRRASNRHFSSFGLALSKICGANDFGFGAHNQFTATELNFMEFQEVLSAIDGAAAA